MKTCYKIAIAVIMLLTLGAFKTSDKDSHPEMKYGWELGVQAYTFRLFPFTTAIRKTDSCNLRFVEAFPGQSIGDGLPGNMGPEMSEATRKAVLQKLKDNHVEMRALGVTGANSEQEWIRLFEFGKAMGIRTLTVEPDEKDIPLLSKLCDEYKINVAIHNHPRPSHYWDPEVVMKAIKGYSKRVGACADIGHWVRSGLDPVECLKKLEGHVLHLHMKDLNDKDPDAHDVHWGDGVSDVPAIIKELKRQHFKGMISAEYEYNWQNNSTDVAASAVNFRNMLSGQQ